MKKLVTPITRLSVLFLACVFLCSCGDSPAEIEQAKNQQAEAQAAETFDKDMAMLRPMRQLATEPTLNAPEASFEKSKTTLWFIIGTHSWSSAKASDGVSGKSIHFAWELNGSWIISDLPMTKIRFKVVQDAPHRVQFFSRYKTFSKWKMDRDPQECFTDQLDYCEIACTDEEFSAIVTASK